MVKSSTYIYSTIAKLVDIIMTTLYFLSLHTMPSSVRSQATLHSTFLWSPSTKSNKATILHYLLEDITWENLPFPKVAPFIQDFMTLFYILANLPLTCGEMYLQVLDQMVAKKHFVLSTDRYHPEFIKPRKGWEVQRLLFWVDPRPGSYIMYSLQMTATKTTILPASSTSIE